MYNFWKPLYLVPYLYNNLFIVQYVGQLNKFLPEPPSGSSGNRNLNRNLIQFAVYFYFSSLVEIFNNSCSLI